MAIAGKNGAVEEGSSKGKKSQGARRGESRKKE